MKRMRPLRLGMLLVLLPAAPLAAFTLRVERPPVSFPEPCRHRVLVVDGTSETPVFGGEGQAVVQAEKADLDGDGRPEICLVLDGGGSGGQRDLLVLARKKGTWGRLFERGELVACRLEVEARTGGDRLRLHHVVRDFDTRGEAEVLTVLGWKDGHAQVVEREAGKVDDLPGTLALVEAELATGRPRRAVSLALRALGKARRPELRVRCLLLAARGRLLEGRVADARDLLKRASEPAGGGFHQEEAERLARLLGASSPGRDRALALRERGIRALGRKRWDRARHLAEAMERLGPEGDLAAEALWLAAEAERGAGRKDEAKRLYRRIVLDHPESPLFSLAEEAVVTFEMGRFVPRRP